MKGKSFSDYMGMLDFLRFSIFVPIAEFLNEEEKVFPESLFLRSNESVIKGTSDSELVRLLRARYMKLAIDSTHQAFENELDMFKLFWN
jgi:hypothetical protein